MLGCASSGSFSSGDFKRVGDPAPDLSQLATPKRLVIIGGNRGIGIDTAKLALARGHMVTVVSRNPNNLDFTHPNLAIKSGNILEPESMSAVIAGNEIVISAVGLPAGSRNVTLFSEGIKNIIPAMQTNSINRLITISAIGAGDSKGHGGFWFDWFLQPFVLTSDIEDKTRQEQIIRSTDLNYTIVRPAVLTDSSQKNTYRVIQNMTGIEAGKISRKDVASFLIASIENDLYIRKTVLISD